MLNVTWKCIFPLVLSISAPQFVVKLHATPFKKNQQIKVLISIYVTFSCLLTTSVDTITTDNNGQHKACRNVHNMCGCASLYIYYTNYKKISRKIPRLPQDFVYGSLHVHFLSMDDVHVCVGVCVHVCSFLSLSPSARPLCQRTLQRAPSCHSRRRTATTKCHHKGKGRNKDREIHKETVVSGVDQKPKKPPCYLSGVPLSLLLYLFLPAAPPACTHIHSALSGVCHRTQHTKGMPKCTAVMFGVGFTFKKSAQVLTAESFSGCNCANKDWKSRMESAPRFFQHTVKCLNLKLPEHDKRVQIEW